MILYFDTETTGLTPGHVIQLSYILDDGRDVKGKNFFFYVPYIPLESTLIHGITVEKLALLSGGHTFFEYLDEIDDDFRKADLVVAHNFSFDFKFMSAEFQSFERIFHFKESFDTMKSFTPIMKLPTRCGKGFKYPKLTELAEFFDVFDYDVTREAIKLFNDSGLSHDARFDTTQMYLSLKTSCEKIPEIKEFLSKYY